MPDIGKRCEALSGRLLPEAHCERVEVTAVASGEALLPSSHPPLIEAHTFIDPCLVNLPVAMALRTMRIRVHAVRSHIGAVRFGLPDAVGHEVDDALRIQAQGPFPVRERRFRRPIVVRRAG